MDLDLQMPINWDLISNPFNWLIIVMILILVSYSFFVISANAGLIPKVG